MAHFLAGSPTCPPTSPWPFRPALWDLQTTTPPAGKMKPVPPAAFTPEVPQEGPPSPPQVALAGIPHCSSPTSEHQLPRAQLRPIKSRARIYTQSEPRCPWFTPERMSAPGGLRPSFSVQDNGWQITDAGFLYSRSQDKTPLTEEGSLHSSSHYCGPDKHKETKLTTTIKYCHAKLPLTAS